MRRSNGSIATWLAVVFSTAAIFTASGSTRADETKLPPDAAGAEALLKQIDAVKPPQLDQSKQKDQAYIQQYIAERRKAMMEKAELDGKFVATYPDHPRAAKLRGERWKILAQHGEFDKVTPEVEAFVNDPAHANDADALFMYAQLSLMKNRANPEQAQDAIDRFIKAAPKDERGAQLLYSTARGEFESDKGKAVARRILADYPDSFAAKQIEGEKRRTAAIGKPFELSFTEAVTGKPVSISDLKGKVVVVDFWATWCGPCVGEMPNMKKMYAEFKPQGVEFIGVSLDQPEDQGGLKALKEFVAKEQIEWPQYYQGKGWESEFSKSWGINSIPCVFVVDANGNLAITDARGKLEQLIPQLIAKRDGKTADAGTR